MEKTVYRYQHLLLPLLCIVSRLPFINCGYGNEGDSWSVAIAANNMVKYGEYFISRPPGRPFQEIAVAGLFIVSKNLGIAPWILPNMLTAVFSSLIVLFFLKICDKENIKKGLQLIWGITFIFFPVFWAKSFSLEDYTWAAFFIITSFLLIRNHKWLLSAIALSIAVANRLEYCLFSIPIALVIFQSQTHNKKLSKLCKLFRFLVISGVLSFMWYLPALSKYGFSTWLGAGQWEWLYSLRHILRFGLFTFEFLPIPMMITIIAIFLQKKFRFSLALPKANLIVAIAAFIIPVGLHIWCPTGVHFIMTMPFFLLLLCSYLNRKEAIVFMFATILSSFVTLNFYNADEHKLSLSLSPGLPFQFYKEAVYIQDYSKKLSVYNFGDSALVLLQTAYPTGGPLLLDTSYTRYWPEGLPEILEQNKWKKVYFFVNEAKGEAVIYSPYQSFLKKEVQDYFLSKNFTIYYEGHLDISLKSYYAFDIKQYAAKPFFLR